MLCGFFTEGAIALILYVSSRSPFFLNRAISSRSRCADGNLACSPTTSRKSSDFDAEAWSLSPRAIAPLANFFYPTIVLNGGVCTLFADMHYRMYEE